MSKPWILLTPSTRGISHSLLHHLLRTTPSTIPILTTTRSPSLPPSYPESDRLHVVNLDVKDESAIQSAAEKARELFPPTTHHLHLALTLPGILLTPPEKSISQITEPSLLETLRVNTLGPVLLMKHFVPFLPKRSAPLEPTEGLPPHATWLSVSARVGSMTDNRLGGWYSYRLSKSALNSAVKTLDLELQQKSASKCIAVGYHPGTVKTDLSRGFWSGVPEANLFSPDDAAEKLWNVITSLNPSQRGKIWDWKGEEVPP
ncbi:uncharacterized protein PODANS_1_19400 [Podospora anserina S mat+]|uniref:Podospora anserina S mat+ genomic DNA chromosome 1, supercontig 4 n=2 Tax=Podospora anserina TaxID=2587412 RepID=B2AUK3_PODAN|nr:uncharacterized protein PODANS_1_19400 [Podospora anserina S mat+]CAP68076.1 unnamed protein product [Podospora anserina S mat+]CDN29860.1 Putative protein of unknown function [Podospora anserina]CDP24332.1 Putative protein of unknown function [Podospora anserina S mat+]